MMRTFKSVRWDDVLFFFRKNRGEDYSALKGKVLVFFLLFDFLVGGQ